MSRHISVFLAVVGTVAVVAPIEHMVFEAMVAEGVCEAADTLAKEEAKNGNQSGRQTPGSVATRYALLIGVTRYPTLGEYQQLQGPANDVLLMRELLCDKFKFLRENIAMLSEAEGTENPARLPTRTNIEREFRRLAHVARKDDQVVVFMAGHGSQQPETTAESAAEPDGLDEIFLPRDIGTWVEGRTVTNAIVDNELGMWLKAIRARGAFVWLVMDSCHSGTMTRGIGEKVRYVPMGTAGLNIPTEDISKAIRAAQARTASTTARARGLGTKSAPAVDSLVESSDAGGFVAIFACQPTEVTVERLFPDDGDNRKYYGLLTHFISRVLTQATESSSRPISYRELVQRVYIEYLKMPRRSPIPVVEGPDQDREILGVTEYSGRSRILLIGPNRINAGIIHGLSNGTILKVFPPPGQGETAMGHVKITCAAVFESIVEPCKYDGLPARNELPQGARFEPLYIALGDLRLHLATDEINQSGQPLAQDLRCQLQERLRKIDGAESIFFVVEDPVQADFLLRPGDHVFYLVPAARAKGPDAEHGAGVSLYGPIRDDNEVTANLQKTLQRIARAVNLQRLAGATVGGLQLNVELTRRATVREGKEACSVSWSTNGIVLHHGDQIEVRIQNPGKVDIDVTILYIDNDYGITCLFPRNEYNRLAPRESFSIPLELDASSPLQEQLVTIAVKGLGEPVDFGVLEQPSLPKIRGDNLNRSMSLPLGELLSSALYAEGNTRGIRRTVVKEFAIHLISWQIRPEPRSALEE